MTLIDQSLGQLARQIPGSTQVFRKYHLNYCCGGKQRLGDALEVLGLDAETVVRELAGLSTASDTDRRWTDASAVELTEHIVERFHNRHRQQLPELTQLAAKVETVHAAHPQCPHGLSTHLKSMWQELDMHMAKEEQILFPMLNGECGVQSRGPLLVMRQEHDDHRQAIERLNQLTHQFQLPSGACNSWHALYAGLQQFCEDLVQHMHLENNILFADAEELLEAYN